MGDASWQAMYDDIARLKQESLQRQRDLIMVAIAEADTERPNANWRRKLSELRNHESNKTRGFSALISPSLLLRGLVTTINWISPPSSKGKLVAIETIEEAISWLQRETGRSMSYLGEMHRACLREAKKRSLP